VEIHIENEIGLMFNREHILIDATFVLTFISVSIVINGKVNYVLMCTNDLSIANNQATIR